MSQLTETFSLSPSETSPLRLDQLLAERFSHYSRTYFQFLIEEGFVQVNGKVAKKGLKPLLGDTITITFTPAEESKVVPENIPLDILYEDDFLIALNKPRGLVVHPGAGNHSGTLANALLFHTKTLPDVGDTLRPGIVHRLDKETSGIILCAKTKEAHAKLVNLFKDRKVEKKYLAVTESVPKEGLLSAPIGRHKIKRKEMCVQEEGGKEAITKFTLLVKDERGALVLAEPKTGRTHQIRVHLKHLKAPIVGDLIYGRKSSSPMLLHALHLTFLHPFTKAPLSLYSPPPKEFTPWLNCLEKKLEKYLSDELF